jgi:hypothetical protein
MQDFVTSHVKQGTTTSVLYVGNTVPPITLTTVRFVDNPNHSMSLQRIHMVVVLDLPCLVPQVNKWTVDFVIVIVRVGIMVLVLFVGKLVLVRDHLIAEPGVPQTKLPVQTEYYHKLLLLLNWLPISLHWH